MLFFMDAYPPEALKPFQVLNVILPLSKSHFSLRESLDPKRLNYIIKCQLYEIHRLPWFI